LSQNTYLLSRDKRDERHTSVGGMLGRLLPRREQMAAGLAL
jgi:hypothetical protein